MNIDKWIYIKNTYKCEYNCMNSIYIYTYNILLLIVETTAATPVEINSSL